jgi:hypothetical protein
MCVRCFVWFSAMKRGFGKLSRDFVTNATQSSDKSIFSSETRTVFRLRETRTVGPLNLNLGRSGPWCKLFATVVHSGTWYWCHLGLSLFLGFLELSLMRQHAVLVSPSLWDFVYPLTFNIKWFNRYILYKLLGPSMISLASKRYSL